ncbi:hypothetical protein [Pantoea brenneri]|uniref:hypothetical protein n=1 Tax=Pantoea brenneri TaxID=472694 RepID=UPI002899519A|nr:hypothetical protein [Pantoea brenneri]
MKHPVSQKEPRCLGWPVNRLPIEASDKLIMLLEDEKASEAAALSAAESARFASHGKGSQSLKWPVTGDVSLIVGREILKVKFS